MSSRPFVRGSQRNELTRPIQNANGKRRHSDNFGQRKRQRGQYDVRPPQLNVPGAVDPQEGIEIKLSGFERDDPIIEAILIQEAVERAFLPYPNHRGEPVNFSVRINPDYPPAAWIIIPWLDVANRFIREEDFIWYNDHELHVAATRKIVEPFHVAQLRCQPYISAAETTARDLLKRHLEERSMLHRVSLGVCHSGVFSTEYTVISEPQKTLEVSYNSNRRALIINRICSGRINSAIALLRDMYHVWANTAQLSVLFRMRNPISFEKSGREHVRTSSFDDDHQFSALTSSVFLIQFETLATFQEFLARTNRIQHFGSTVEKSFAIQDRKIYAQRHFDVLDSFFESLSLSTALACEQLLRSGALTPLELINMQEDINNLEKEDQKLASLTLQSLLVEDVVNRPASNLEQMFRDARSFAEVKLAFARSPRNIDTDVALCPQVHVTPTGFILETATPDRANRILRLYSKYQTNFMRVTFTDEGGQCNPLRKPFATKFDWDDFIGRNVGDVLKKGFKLAGRRWEWLGYSSSALKEKQMLFMAPFTDENAVLINSNHIRAEIGIFNDIKLTRQPAKYGARLGQAFSATTASVTICDTEIREMDDILTADKEYNFTDGAGDMSLEMAESIWGSMRRHGSSTPPSAFQARFMGCKGVWMVNSTLVGKQIRYTPSQKKFDSNARGFEIANTSQRPGNTFLNRPLVKLLEDLGVTPEIFLQIQAKAVATVEAAQTDFPSAAELFRSATLGTSFHAPRLFNDLHNLKIDFTSSPRGHIDFFKSVTLLAITHSLRDIKFRARIEVAGPTLIGVCDTLGVLKEGEIYVKLKTIKGIQPALKGRFPVTRSPVIHPGDVQMATAIGEVEPSSPLADLYNVVVFSSKGKRPLPSMLGGGDLDGDIFNVITDHNLFPRDDRIHAPAQYKPADPFVLPRPSQMADIADFVVNYIINDSTGKISSMHLALADYSDLGSFDPDCIKLAELASQAVDFIKSGRPVNKNDYPRKRTKMVPDFMQGPNEDKTNVYPSEKALGRMFRAVPLQKFIRPEGAEQHAVDAHVLHEIIMSIKSSFPGFKLDRYKYNMKVKLWTDFFLVFTKECEKIAFRNSFSRHDDHRLGEEELFLGTTGTIAKVDPAEWNMLHAMRTQMSDLTRKMRNYIKADMKDDDEDLPSDDDFGLDHIQHVTGYVVKKEESPTVYGINDSDKAVGINQAVAIKSEDPDDSDDDVQEIEVDEWRGKIKVEEVDDDIEEISAIDFATGSVKTEPHTKMLLDSKDNIKDEIEETSRPDWRLLAIRRAFIACDYALDQLESENPPFGTRLFAMCALDMLIGSLLKHTPEPRE